MTNLSPIVAELERLYGVIGDSVFRDRNTFPDAFEDDALKALDDQPVISVASRGRKRTVNGWYVPAVWSDVTDDLLDAIVGPEDGATLTRRAEIVVSSEVLRDDAIVIATELARGMACHVIARMGESVPTGPNYWHTSAWRDTYAPAFGCEASVNPDQPSKGWSVLKPGADFVSTLSPKIAPDVFDISRDADTSKTDDRRSGMSVYRCKCSRFRSAVPIVARCEECSELFRYADSRAIPARVADVAARRAVADEGWETVYGSALTRDANASANGSN